MNSLRIRVVKLKPDHGVGTEFPYAVQVSEGGLSWWTIARLKEFDPALNLAKELYAFVKSNVLVKDESVLWSAQL